MGYEFSFKFRTRVTRQGGFAPLKSPTGGRAPRPPPYFIAFLNAGWWADSCVKILNQNLQRWRSYDLPKIYTNFWLDCDHSLNQEGWFWFLVTIYWFWESKFHWFTITPLTIMYSMKRKWYWIPKGLQRRESFSLPAKYHAGRSGYSSV